MAESQHAILILKKQLKGPPGRGRRGGEPHTAPMGDPSVQMRVPLTPAASPTAELTRHPVDGFSAGLVDDSNIFEWQVGLLTPPCMGGVPMFQNLHEERAESRARGSVLLCHAVLTDAIGAQVTVIGPPETL